MNLDIGRAPISRSLDGPNETPRLSSLSKKLVTGRSFSCPTTVISGVRTFQTLRTTSSRPSWTYKRPSTRTAERWRTSCNFRWAYILRLFRCRAAARLRRRSRATFCCRGGLARQTGTLQEVKNRPRNALGLCWLRIPRCVLVGAVVQKRSGSQVLVCHHCQAGGICPSRVVVALLPAFNGHVPVTVFPAQILLGLNVSLQPLDFDAGN